MIYIFGHKNPDTDSICSAVALSMLKRKMGIESKACAIDSINKEAEYVLNRFGVDHPLVIEDIKTEVKDLIYDKRHFVDPNSSILQVFKTMKDNELKILPVCNTKGYLLGIVTMKDIAMGLIQSNDRQVKTHMKNILNDLEGKMLVGEMVEVDGKIMVMAYFHKTLAKKNILNKSWISIVGDNYENIEFCINAGVQLLVVTGNNEIPKRLMNLAKEKKVPIMTVSLDTYMTSKKIGQCTYVSSIMRSEDICTLKEYEYLDHVHKQIRNHRHSFYPVVDQKSKFLGFIDRSQLMNPKGKKVIMVDHNEYSQSAIGIEEAEIMEVVDHHKIGSIRTNMPISFRNMPVGSTCTIVYKIYRESGFVPDLGIAGLLLSGIISDTLNFKSPTTTEIDIEVASELNQILKIDVDSYAKEMFKVGTSLEGLSIEEIFYRDFKKFEYKDREIGVSQVLTMDIEGVMNRKDEILDFMKKEHDNNKYVITLLVITDIINEGSTLLFKTEFTGVIEKAFNVNESQGMFVRNIISRKKQVIPKLIEALHQIDVDII